MKTPVQTSFQSRLSAAGKLKEYISTFADYNPDDEEMTPAGLQSIINNIDGIMAKHTHTGFGFSEASRKRAALFYGTPGSIQKTTTKIRAYTMSKYGKESQQYASLNRIVGRLRGEKQVKLTLDATEKTISRAETSFGAQLANFTEMLTLIGDFANYNAPTALLSLETLQTQRDAAEAANDEVTLKFAAFKPKIAERQEAFRQLLRVTNRIKNYVIAQYGRDSTEYRLISGLKFPAK